MVACSGQTVERLYANFKNAIEIITRLQAESKEQRATQKRDREQVLILGGVYDAQLAIVTTSYEHRELPLVQLA